MKKKTITQLIYNLSLVMWETSINVLQAYQGGIVQWTKFEGYKSRDIVLNFYG